MSCNPWLINMGLGYVIDTLCVLAFILYHYVKATLICLLNISALWTAASSFWNLYSSHALSCNFWKVAVLSALLSLVLCYLVGWFKDKRHLWHSPTTVGFYRNDNFLNMGTWVKPVEVPYYCWLYNCKEVTWAWNRKGFFKKSLKLNSVHCTHWCHGNLWPEDIN